MLKTLFSKLFVMYTIIILVSFILLAALLSKGLENYFIKQKEDLLISQGQKIGNQYALAYYTGVFDKERLGFELKILDDYMKARIWFVDKDGQVYIESSEMNKSFVGQKLTKKEIQTVLDGNIIKVKGSFGGRFKEAVITIGYPIKTNNSVIGAIFMHAPMPEIKKNITDICEMTILCLTMSILVSYIVIYIMTRKITKPLKEMNYILKDISLGKLDKRVKISSEDEIGELGESFNYMANELSKAEKVRKNFISNVSHDIRTPLTSINGFVEAILDKTIEEKDQEKYLKIIKEETKRLIKLSNDIIQLTKIENELLVLNKNNFNIFELIQQVMEIMEQRIKEKNLTLNIQKSSDNTIVYADKEKIERVIYNLIDNAIKFSNDNGAIDVKIVETKNKIEIQIKDTGIGINEKDLEYIWDRFYKVDNSRGHNKTSTGLGLSIVKEIINVHNEKIYITSELGKGTTFSFMLQKEK